jgi:quaternary ammonium compound-resistance protein SugE
MQWIYLLIAAVFEAAWTFSLKYLDFQKIKTIQWDTIFSMNTWVLISPLLGYIFLGLAIFIFCAGTQNAPYSRGYGRLDSPCLGFYQASRCFYLT